MNDQLGFGTENIDGFSLNSIAFGSNSQIIMFFDENRKVIYSNPASARFFNETNEAGLRKNLQGLVNEKQPDGQNTMEYLMQKFDEAEEKMQVEFETHIRQREAVKQLRTIVKSIHLGDRNIFMTVSEDVTALNESETKLAGQARQISVLNYVGELLLSADYHDFGDMLKIAVEIVGRAFDNAKTTLCRLESDDEGTHCAVMYSWNMEGLADKGSCLPESWIKRLSSGNLIRTTLSESEGEYAEFMRKNGILSTIIIPIMTDEVWGFIGLFFKDDEHVFYEAGINALFGIANLLATGFVRHKSTGMLMEAVNTNRVLLDSNPFSSIIMDENGNFIDCNKSAMDYFRLNDSKDLKTDFFNVLNEFVPEFKPGGRKALRFQERLKMTFEAGYCEFDTNFMVDKKQRYFHIIMKKVVYKNLNVAAIYMFDLTAQKEIQHTMEHNNRLLETLGSVANLLLTTGAVALEMTMSIALGLIGVATAMDRAYVWKNSVGEDGRVYSSQIYEWSPDATPQQGGVHAVDVPLDEMLPTWKETLLKGRSINLIVKNAPPEEQAQLEPQGIVSLLIVPIFMQSKFWGFIGLDDCKKERIFSDVEENFLRICGFMTMAICDAIQNEMSIQLRAEKEEAVISAQIKTNFLANMSHEIRTPMNAILGMVELIMHENATDAVLSYATDIRSACRGLLSIINDILDISKIESGKLEISPMRYHISSLLVDVINIVKMRIEKKSINFIVNIDPNIPSELVGDEVRIKQVLINLLNNAIKFTHEGQITMSVRSRVEGDVCRLIASVKDTGIGIRNEDMEKIFVLFQQVDTKKNRNIEGTGLGLSISKQLVEMMNGSIKVQSEYGVGSIFTATIMQPIANRQPMTALKKPGQTSVLVYENRPAYLNSLKYTLDSLGCKYEICANRSEINHYLDDFKYNYIFVSSLHINKIHTIAAQRQPDALIVALSTTGHSYSSHMAISMPIHCLQIADILNGEYGHNEYRNDELNINSIIAPEAKVLVVDDNAVNLKVAVGLLSIYKIKADTALSGMRCLEMVKEKDYDLVFMDHMMPDMDGIDTTVAIRGLGGKYSGLPIIALTANAIGGVREMFKAEGLDDFLAKPVEMTKLNAMLKKWIPKDKQMRSTEIITTEETYFIIPGLDTRRGIINSGGTPEAYDEILEIYAADCENRLLDMKKYHMENDMKALNICVHAIKSASANIGASEISKMAAELESAGKINDINYVNMNIHHFCDSITILLGCIRRYLDNNLSEDAPQNKPADFDLLKDSVAEIEQYMNNLDIDSAENVLKDLYVFQWDDDTFAQIYKIKECIDIFDYDGIDTAVGKLKKISGVE